MPSAPDAASKPQKTRRPSVRSSEAPDAGESKADLLESLDDGMKALVGTVVGIAEGLAKAKARKASCAMIEHDLISAANKAICRASQSYNPSVGTSFRSYAIGGVAMALNDELRRQRPMGHRRKYDPSVKVIHSGAGVPYCVPCESGDIASVDAKDSFDGWMGRLLPEQERVMRMMFEAGVPSFKEVGKQIGKSSSEVSEIYHQSICALRNEVKSARAEGRA